MRYYEVPLEVQVGHYFSVWNKTSLVQKQSIDINPILLFSISKNHNLGSVSAEFLENLSRPTQPDRTLQQALFSTCGFSNLIVYNPLSWKWRLQEAEANDRSLDVASVPIGYY